MRKEEKVKKKDGSVSTTSANKKRTIIGIDPDSEKSGFSVLCPELKLYANICSLSFPALMKELQTWKRAAEYEDAELHVYIEGGWLNKSNWHLTTGKYTNLAKAAEIGRCTGRNHQTGILIGEMCEALGIAYTKGIVTYEDVRADIELLHQYPWSKAQGYNCNSSEKKAKFYDMSMADYMRYLWNNPQNGQSPYKLFEGALVPTGKDDNGNLIYKYNGAKF